MIQSSTIKLFALVAILAPTCTLGLQLANWPPVQVGQQQQQQQQLTGAQQPMAAELHNQVSALSAQLAAANRQIQYYQQQLSSISSNPANDQQQQAQLVQSQPLNQPATANDQQQQFLAQQQLANQQILAPQQQLQQQQQQMQQSQPQPSEQQQPQIQQFPAQFFGQSLAALQQFQLQQQAQQQQQLAQSQPQQQQQQQPAAASLSTLVDDSVTRQLSADPRLAGQPEQMFYQQQQQQQPQQPAMADVTRLSSLSGQQMAPPVQQPATTSTTASPPALEQPSFASNEVPTSGNSLTQPSSQLDANTMPAGPPSSHAPVHTGPARNDDKFSIGLGVLSPGYTQKFGNTALDFNQDKNGYSFTLSNNGHSNSNNNNNNNNQQQQQQPQQSSPKAA